MEQGDAKPVMTQDGQGGENKGITALAEKYKAYENNKELVKDDNPYR